MYFLILKSKIKDFLQILVKYEWCERNSFYSKTTDKNKN